MIREHIVNQKVAGRDRSGPATDKRGARSSPKQNAKSGIMSDVRELLDELRALKPYLMIAGVCILSIVMIVLLFFGYRAAASSSFFYLKDINVSGTARASSDEVKAIVRRSVTKSGVWSADLVNIKREIEKLPWVRSAIVSRVLPDGVRVRVTERVPSAVIRLSKDRLMLVDEEANILGPTANADRPAPFVLRGWDEGITDAAKEDNRERVEVYRALASECSLLGLASRVSEVNLSDVTDIRALVSFGEGELEVRLGDKDFGARLQGAIKKVEESRSIIWSCHKYIDVSQGVEPGDRIAVGPVCSAEELERIKKAEAESVNSAGLARDATAATTTRKEIKVEPKPKSESDKAAKKNNAVGKSEVKPNAATPSGTETKKTGSNEAESSKSVEVKKIETATKSKTEQKTNNNSAAKNKNASQTPGKSEKKNSNAKPQETRPRKV